MSFVMSAQPNVIPIQANPVVSNNSGIITLPLVGSNIAPDNSRVSYLIEPSLYPTVGLTYMITISPIVSATFGAQATGTFGLLLEYRNASYTNIFVRASDYKTVFNVVDFGYNASITIVFTHTDASNILSICLDNLTNQVFLAAESDVLVECIASLELGTSSKNITASDFVVTT